MPYSMNWGVVQHTKIPWHAMHAMLNIVRDALVVFKHTTSQSQPSIENIHPETCIILKSSSQHLPSLQPNLRALPNS